MLRVVPTPRVVPMPRNVPTPGDFPNPQDVPTPRRMASMVLGTGDVPAAGCRHSHHPLPGGIKCGHEVPQPMCVCPPQSQVWSHYEETPVEDVVQVLEEKERTANYKPVFVTEITDDLHFYVQDVETGTGTGLGSPCVPPCHLSHPPTPQQCHLALRDTDGGAHPWTSRLQTLPNLPAMPSPSLGGVCSSPGTPPVPRIDDTTAPAPPSTHGCSPPGVGGRLYFGGMRMLDFGGQPPKSSCPGCPPPHRNPSAGSWGGSGWSGAGSSPSTGAQLEKLMENMRTEVGNHPPVEGSYAPRRGDFCIAKFVDGEW